MRNIEPLAALGLLARGAVLIDIRAADEHRREHIPGALCIPLDTLQSALRLPAGVPVVFHCRSGLRTGSNAARLAAAAGDREAWLLDGGLDGWTRSGLPTARAAGAPVELGRQVQLAVGAVVLTGSVLAATLSPWFLLLTALPGLGLLVAGATGFCGLAHVLARMPWNRTPA